MKEIIYCTMCLGVNMKMFIMNSQMISIYNGLLIKHMESAQKQMYACFECAHLLHKYEAFKTKCCKAFNIICSLKLNSFEATQEILSSIDRNQNKLESQLKKCPTNNYYQTCHQHQLCNSVNEFDIKTELILFDIEQNDEQDNHLQDVINFTTTDPCTSSDIGTKFTSTETTTEYIDHSLNTLKPVISTTNKEINKACISDEKTKNSLALNVNTHLESEIKLELKFDDRNVDSDCTVLDKCQIKVESNNLTKIEKSTVKKRKYNKKNDKSCDRENKLKRCKKEQPKNEAAINDMQMKISQTKKSNKNEKTNSKVTNSTKRVRIFSIVSTVFKEYVTVVELSRADAIKEFLQRKESNNYKANPFKCDLCYRGFISASTYQTHMKKHSLAHGTLKCDICQLNFMASRYLTNHRVCCHTRKFLCKMCPYVCFSAQQARDHMHSHKGKKYTCKECGEIFRFPNSLSTHMRIRHGVEVVCEFCGSTYATLYGLECHKRMIHREEQNEQQGPQCVECDVHFASELAWKRHLVLCSRHQVQHGCGVCGAACATAAALRAHLRRHGPLRATRNACMRVRAKPARVGSAPQSCSYCNTELRNNKEYQIHMASDHPEVGASGALERVADAPKWVCEVCGKIFKHQYQFTEHHAKHTGDKPYACGECGERFKRADALRSHCARHEAQPALQCHLCDKRYADRIKLNRHLKRHLRLRPHKCAYCDKSFEYQYIANVHTKHVHCKEPYPKRDRSKRSTVKTNVEPSLDK